MPSTQLHLGNPGLYVWRVYPLIPQSFGGGAPTTVRLLVNPEEISPYLSGLLGIDADANGKDATKASVTGSIKLLYSTADQYYIEGPDKQRLSLGKSVVEGVLWDPAKPP